MNRPKIFLVLGLLVLMGGFLFLLWPHKTTKPLLRLKIVRQTKENGRPVVFFRVQATDHRRIVLDRIERVIGERAEVLATESFFSDGHTFYVGIERIPLVRGQPSITSHGLLLFPGFWPPSTPNPVGDLKQGRKTFGVLGPTNARVWKLRVQACVEMATLQRFNQIRMGWMDNWRKGKPCFKAAWEAWNTFYGIRFQEVDSDFITNTLPQL